MYALMTWSALYNFSFDEEGAISAYREKVLKSFELWNPKNDEIDQQKRATEIRTKTKRIKTTIKTQHQRQKALLLYDRDYFFYYTLGVGFLVSFIVVLFSIVSVDSSYWCGPFGFENQYDPNVDGSADASISIVDTVKFYTNDNAVLGIWRNSRFNFGLTLILIYVFWFVNGLGKNRQGTVEDIKARYLRKWQGELLYNFGNFIYKIEKFAKRSETFIRRKKLFFVKNSTNKKMKTWLSKKHKFNLFCHLSCWIFSSEFYLMRSDHFPPLPPQLPIQLILLNILILRHFPIQNLLIYKKY